MAVDTAILGIAMTAVTQGANAFTQYVPKLADIRKADAATNGDMVGDVRIGEIAAVTVTLGVGVIASGLTGNPVPAFTAAIVCIIMLVLYETALRGDHPFQPRTEEYYNG